MKWLTALMLAALAIPASAAPETARLERADGGFIHYTIDAPEGRSAGLVVLAQGSGCAPGARNASIAVARAAFPAHTALIVEKVGITPDAAVGDGFTDCPSEFHSGYTVSQRVEDYVSVLAAVRPQVPGELVLFGGSEGGLAMAMLAARIHPDAAIILSSATGMPFADMVRSTVPPEGHATIDAGFAAARANPQSTELFAGSTYRFWADMLDRTALAEMESTDTPFLVIQGGSDTSSPVAAARLTADSFAAAGRCNLTYWEFPALDHGMRDPAGVSRLETILRQAALWAQTPQTACAPGDRGVTAP